MTSLDRVLNSLYPGAQWSLDGDTYAGLIWHSDTPKPTEKELEDGRTKVEALIAKAESDKAKAKQSVLDRLGITADEAALLLG